MNAFARIATVARYELSDSLRSRRAAVMLLLYVAVAVMACNSFISTIKKVEDQLAEALDIPPGKSVGATTEVLWQSRMFRRMVTRIVGDEDVARGLFDAPPIALLYGWAVFFFTPPLVMLLTSSRVAEEVASGSARYALTRTARGEWIMGKYLGQCLLVVVALAFSAMGGWSITNIRLPDIDGWHVAAYMLAYTGKAWFYVLPFIGLSLGISQATRTPVLAMTLGFLAWIVTMVLYGVSLYMLTRGTGRIWTLLQVLLPQGQRMDLWRVALAPQAMAALYLGIMSLAYLLLGYAWFSRRDL